VPTAAQPIRLVLTDGKVRKEVGQRLSFTVRYRFEQGGPAGAARLLWVVQSARSILLERLVVPAELGSDGTLSATTLTPGLLPNVTLSTFLVVENLVPGQPGLQRTTVSNTLTLRP
jgi:hypothetical protein